MATLQAADIGDLVTTTQKDLGPLRFTDVASKIQKYVAFNELLRRERVTFGSGYELQWSVMVEDSGAAKMTGLFEVDQVNVPDVMKTASSPFRHVNTNWAIERREIKMNREPARIVELVKTRRYASLVSLAALLETQFWADPADNSKDMFGIRYWIVRDGTQGFNGGNPTNFSGGAGGISSTTYPRWSNWTDRYTNITKSDLVKKVREAATKTDFRPPAPHASYNTGNDYGHYTNYDVIGPMEEALEAQNDNLGNDVASKDGMTLFRQVPVTYVPELDDDTTDPWFGINWGDLNIGVLAGEWLVEMNLTPSDPQHTVFKSHIDASLNTRCTNRRCQFIVDKA